LRGAGAAAGAAAASITGATGAMLCTGTGAADDVTCSVDVEGVGTAIEVGATLADVVKATLAWTTGGATTEVAAMLMLVLVLVFWVEVEMTDDEASDEEGEAI